MGFIEIQNASQSANEIDSRRKNPIAKCVRMSGLDKNVIQWSKCRQRVSNTQKHGSGLSINRIASALVTRQDLLLHCRDDSRRMRQFVLRSRRLRCQASGRTVRQVDMHVMIQLMRLCFGRTSRENS